MKFFNLRAKNILIYIAFLLPSMAFSQAIGPGGTNTNGAGSTQVPTADIRTENLLATIVSARIVGRARRAPDRCA